MFGFGKKTPTVDKEKAPDAAIDPKLFEENKSIAAQLAIVTQKIQASITKAQMEKNHYSAAEEENLARLRKEGSGL